MVAWFSGNWFTLLNSIGIIGSLLFTAISLQSESKTRRIANLLTLTQNHREVWSKILRHPILARVLDASANSMERSISVSERLFMNMLIQHLGSAYEAIKMGLAIKPE